MSVSKKVALVACAFITTQLCAQPRPAPVCDEDEMGTFQICGNLEIAPGKKLTVGNEDSTLCVHKIEPTPDTDATVFCGDVIVAYGNDFTVEDGCSANFDAAAHFNDVVDFNDKVTFNDQVCFNDNINLGSDVTVQGEVCFDDFVTFKGGTNIEAGGGGDGEFSTSDDITFEGNVTFNSPIDVCDDVTFKEKALFQGDVCINNGNPSSNQLITGNMRVIGETNIGAISDNGVENILRIFLNSSRSAVYIKVIITGSWNERAWHAQLSSPFFNHTNVTKPITYRGEFSYTTSSGVESISQVTRGFSGKSLTMQKVGSSTSPTFRIRAEGGTPNAFPAFGEVEVFTGGRVFYEVIGDRVTSVIEV